MLHNYVNLTRNAFNLQELYAFLLEAHFISTGSAEEPSNEFANSKLKTLRTKMKHMRSAWKSANGIKEQGVGGRPSKQDTLTWAYVLQHKDGPAPATIA